MRKIELLAFVLCLAGCGSTPGAPADAAGDVAATPDVAVADDVASPRDTALPPVDGAAHEFTLTMGPIHLTPGQETTMCMLVRLGNATPQYMRRIRTHIGDRSHHLVVFRSNATTEQSTPVACRGFSGLTNPRMPESPLIIAQQRDATLTMPDGVGMNLAANQMIRLEMHAINTTSAPIDVSGTATLETAERSADLTPADVFFWGTFHITVPSHSTGEAHFFSQPLAGANIFGLTSHTHHYGTLATISTATNATSNAMMATDLMELHRSTDWSDPPLTVFSPAITVPEGQGLHLACRYNNTSDAPVTFGESVNNEMCFLWAYYYPAPQGLQVCFDQTGTTQCSPSR